ncbi:amino acid adenylation domain-containing protein [Corallococcus sp. bb12-1]|uniref:amino acid adenylation domain-containing protein n=1 Tax=Corallococcus sp. bb12-1 TaxID=2996784 RepID=UPI002270C8F2|nr:amino acid adenylation domain-containing protein [Corallococcus sp. bb12-1]MCY1042400.1 amino acid adenylation domain-containing protein [Corallococcus sp. bb12-1]
MLLNPTAAPSTDAASRRRTLSLLLPVELVRGLASLTADRPGALARAVRLALQLVRERLLQDASGDFVRQGSHAPLRAVSAEGTFREALDAAPREEPDARCVFDWVEQGAEDRGAVDATLQLRFSPSPDGLQAELCFDPARHEEDAAQRLGAQVVTVLDRLVGTPDARLGEVETVSPQARALMLGAWNGEARAHPFDACLHELFEARAARTPDAIAVVAEADDGSRVSLTYAELDARANQVARWLRARGLALEEPVAVLVRRGENTHAAILGLWKAGGAYVPLDEGYPAAQIAFILRDSGARMLLTEESFRATRELAAEHVLCVDGLTHLAPDDEAEAPAPGGRPLSPTHFSLLLYTSGSTGNPKGVKHRQVQLLNRFQWLWEHHPLQPGHVMCQRTPLNFQPSLWELMGGLLQGIPTVVLPDRVVKDPRLLAERLHAHAITHITFVPSLLWMLLEGNARLGEKLRKLEWIIAAGEPLERRLVARLQESAPWVQVLCDYGSTETNGVLFFDTTRGFPEDTLPAFRPIANVRAYVLDEALRLMPPEVPGELFFSGACVAEEYWKRPELTRERFFANPFETPGHPVLYRTGDFAFWTAEGGLRLTGRRDEQVKIRGNRVDLRGVEQALRETLGVHEVKALGDRRGGTVRLLAYVSPAPGASLSGRELREQLAQRLPGYMVPSSVHIVAALPRLPNGKVDVQRLLLNETPSGERPAPDALRDRLARHVAQVLGLPASEVGFHDRYYALGFDSASIAELAVVLGRDGLDVSVSDLYSYPSLEELAGWLLGRSAEVRAEGETRAPRPESPPSALRSPPSNFTKPPSRPPPTTPRTAFLAPRPNRPAAGGESEAIAVISVAGRFPTAPDVDAFWELLVTGRDALSPAPASRWRDAEELKPPAVGGFLDDVDAFDPFFFDISPREALLMDPQQRLVLEECWNVLESAGQATPALDGKKVGVFLGARAGDYADLAGQRGSGVSGFGLMGADQAILSARTAYWLNLLGPALTLDTACSSSLMAIHLACQSLRAGECEMSIAGGVHVMSTSHMHRASAQLGMVSRQGRCMSFDARADGMVPSEAVAVVLLKPLSAALRDGDLVHAVILGSGANQDGRTNGITAPSARAQQELLEDLYGRIGVSPETLGYLEAHGTGTRQGDPIEVQALSRAWAKWTSRRRFCALGSVKTQVGHAVTAAGAVGFIKAVLALRQGMLPGSLHFQRPNPDLVLTDSPFFVNTLAAPWHSAPAVARRAGVSSFGFSGTNCHVVLEEAPPRAERSAAQVSSGGPFVLPLSGKTRGALVNNARRLLQWLDLNAHRVRLEDVAHTLQRGRTHFEQRACVIAGDVREACERLEHVVQGTHDTRESGPVLDAMAARVASRYLAGEQLDWAQALPSAGRHILLPTYGFERQRYWVEAAPSRPWFTLGEAPLQDAGWVSARIPVDAFVFAEHHVGGVPVLAGAALLEVARAAAERLLGETITALSDIHWLRPLQATASGEMELWLQLKRGEGDVRFQIASGDATAPVPLCEGRAWGGVAMQGGVGQGAEALAEASRSAPLCLPDPYEGFKRQGVSHGAGFRVLSGLRHGAEVAVASFALPPGSRVGHDVLHPAVLDGVFQSAAGVEPDTGATTAAVPFAVQRIEWCAPLPERGTVVARAESTRDVSSPRATLHVHAEDGRLVCRVQGFVRRRREAARPALELGARSTFFQWAWREEAGRATTPPARVRVLNLAGELWGRLGPGPTDPRTDDAWCVETRASLQDDLGTWLASAERPEAVAVLLPDTSERVGGLSEAEVGERLLMLVQAFAREQAQRPLLLALFAPATSPERAESTALGGLARALNREGQRLKMRAVGVERDASMAEVVRRELALLDEPRAEIHYARGTRYVRDLSRYEPPRSEDGAGGLRHGGVYVITGGLGGVGYALSEHLARRWQARLVLLGRSPLTGELEGRLEALRRLGASPLYRVCDVGDEQALSHALSEARRRHGVLHGVIHCAGVTRDRLLVNKQREDIRAVLQPKVSGAVLLDRLLAHEPLDFFVLFSSIAFVIGSPGQGDYAYANAFLDALATERAARVSRGERSGRTLSLAWPYWKDGGMRVGAPTLQGWKDEQGLEPLSSEEACLAFEAALRGGARSLVLHHGDARRFGAFFAPVQPTLQTGAGVSRERLEPELLRLVSQVMGADVSRVSATRDLSDYGFESILMGELAQRIRATFGVPLTLSELFDCSSVARIATHLLDTHGASLGKVLEEEARPATVEPPALEPLPAPPARPEREPIAIVGMAARLPGADDTDAFLSLLVDGRSAFQPFPAGRRSPAEKGPPPLGAYVEDADCFDAAFFGISAHEARLMDPQQRLLLETTWAAIENMGQRPSRLRGSRTGVFVGVFSHAHVTRLREEGQVDDPYLLSASDHAMIANRVSFYFDWRGPSESVDTACSSSLVALHHALQALRSGDCDTAVVAGVHLLSEAGFAVTTKAGLLSPDGVSRPFDAEARGYLRGEGVGVLLLKPLSAATRAGDPVHALVLGSAVTHGGKAFALTAPSAPGQTRAVVDALRASGVDPRSVSYVEAHGTGSPVSDATELRALRQAFVEVGSPVAEGVLQVGSLKGNIGHLEAASGVASLIKMALCLSSRQLPGVVGFSRMSEETRALAGPLRVSSRTEPWRAPSPLRCGVHTFGLGGTNAHAILQEAPAGLRAAMSRPAGAVLLVFSARTRQSLEGGLIRMVRALSTEPAPSLEDVAHTLALGREPFEVRAALLAASPAQAVQRILQLIQSGPVEGSSWTSWARASRPVEGLDAAVARGELSVLAAGWCAGADIAWERLEGLQHGRRIPLPTYHFERQRHWEMRPQAQAPAPRSASMDLATQVLAMLAATLGGDLGPEQLHVPLADLGFDSIMALKLRHRLNETLGMDFSGAHLTERDTPHALVQFVVAETDLVRPRGSTVASREPVDAGVRERVLRGELSVDELSQDQVDALMKTLESETR